MAARVRWVSPRSRHIASPYSSGSESLLITHPFHPLAGQRVSILFERTYKNGERGRVYVCEGGTLGGTVTVPEHFTDRSGSPAARPLTVDVLIELAAVVAAFKSRLTSQEERTSLVPE